MNGIIVDTFLYTERELSNLKQPFCVVQKQETQ